MPYIERLKAIKEERGLSNAEIAKLANVSLATVTKIFNGSTTGPSIDTFVPIVTALGASVDEIVGLKVSDAPPIDQPIQNTLNSYAELLKEKDERINDLKAEVKEVRKEKHRFSLACTIIVGFILLLLTIDILNGHWGYLRY